MPPYGNHTETVGRLPWAGVGIGGFFQPFDLQG